MSVKLPFNFNDISANPDGAAAAGEPAAAVQADISRQMLQAALSMAGDSVPSLIFGIATLAWIAFDAGLVATGIALVLLGTVSVVSRLILARRYRRGAVDRQAEVSRTEREFALLAIWAGMLWGAAVLFVYPHASGFMGTLVLLICCGAVAVAAFFFALIRHAFLLFATPTVAAAVGVSVFVEGQSPIIAMSAIVFAAAMMRASGYYRRVTTLAIRSGLEAEAANKALRHANKEAEAANLAKSQFLANMSHEIRTPMIGILGSLELLAGSRLDARQRTLADTASSSGEALLSVLNEVLDFSKIEAGKLDLRREAFAPCELAQSAISLFSAGAQRKGLALDFVCDPRLSRRLLGDAGRLRQVLLNLIGNAIKFTDCGGVQLRLQCVAAEPDEVRVLFEVEDSGIGIDAAGRERLFTPFHQADQSAQRRHGGTGLGLAICRRLVNAMGGEIGLNSEAGHGSRFHFELGFEVAPAGTADTPCDVDSAANMPLAGRVLLVEDVAVNRMIAVEMLKSLGIEAVVAENGERALAILATTPVSLVLMDCQMPVMDGFLATQRLREREAAAGAPRTPVIALTANALSGDAQRCLAAGMDGYLAKPYTKAQLRATLAPWLAGAAEALVAEQQAG